MTISETPMAKRIRWSECQPVAEVALMLDALPPDHRAPILNAAVRFEPGSDFSESYLVGEIRVLIVDSIVQLYGQAVATRFENIAKSVDHDDLFSQLAFHSDPAVMQLAVCDLLEHIAVEVSHHEQ